MKKRIKSINVKRISTIPDHFESQLRNDMSYFQLTDQAILGVLSVLVHLLHSISQPRLKILILGKLLSSEVAQLETETLT